MFEILLFLGLVEPVKPLEPLLFAPVLNEVVEEVEVIDREPFKCLCVAYARTFMPSIPYPMDADELKANGTPDLGNGILFRYGLVSHIAVIKGFTDEGWLVTEANRTPCEIEERIVKWNDKSIVGFIQK